jgi:uncharacterized protein
MISQDIVEQIQKYAIKTDWEIAFDGKAKGNRHLFRVVTIARFLAEKEEAQKDICEAGAWIHDISLADGNDDNPTKVRASVEAFLARLPLDNESRRRIAECAEAHEGAADAVSIEAKIVHDADALDKMGILGIIRHTWKIVNLIQTDANARQVYVILQKHLRARKEKLYTETAKILVHYLNEALSQFFADEGKALRKLEYIMEFARAGITSDEIAKRLLYKEDIPVLIDQLYITNELLEAFYTDANETRIRSRVY